MPSPTMATILPARRSACPRLRLVGRQSFSRTSRNTPASPRRCRGCSARQHDHLQLVQRRPRRRLHRVAKGQHAQQFRAGIGPAQRPAIVRPSPSKRRASSASPCGVTTHPAAGCSSGDVCPRTVASRRPSKALAPHPSGNRTAVLARRPLSPGNGQRMLAGFLQGRRQAQTPPHASALAPPKRRPRTAALASACPSCRTPPW